MGMGKDGRGEEVGGEWWKWDFLGDTEIQYEAQRDVESEDNTEGIAIYKSPHTLSNCGLASDPLGSLYKPTEQETHTDAQNLFVTRPHPVFPLYVKQSGI